jgi:hypothetical protein
MYADTTRPPSYAKPVNDIVVITRQTITAERDPLFFLFIIGLKNSPLLQWMLHARFVEAKTEAQAQT